MTSVAFNFEDENVLGYSRYGFFEDEGYEIIEFKDLLKEKEKIMTTAEKLRFLADRVEDEQEFKVDTRTFRVLDPEGLQLKRGGIWVQSGRSLTNLLDNKIELLPHWAFTEEERIILKNLSSKWQYLARDKDYCLYAYERPPRKPRPDSPFYERWSPTSEFVRLEGFEHLFESINWQNEEACPFREYI